MLKNIQYVVGAKFPASHYFDVSLMIAKPDSDGQELWLPDWIPGSYMIRDFAKNLTPLQAFDANNAPVTVHVLDKSSWRCAPCVGPLHIRYRVYAWDLSVRTALLDQHGGFFNASSLLIAVRGQEQQPHYLTLQEPLHTQPDDQPWRVATSLTRHGAEPLGFGEYVADNYLDLIDHPVEIGQFDYREFTVEGVRHGLAITGQHRGDLARLCHDLSRICRAQIQFFGGAPFDHYLFLLRVVDNGYGGLEHMRSTSLLCSRDNLPGRREPIIPSDGYTELLGLCSHEYFHSWNVKRLKPRPMCVPQLQAPTYSDLLWFFEGITSYYDDLLLCRSAVVSAEHYLKLLGGTIGRYLQNPGRKVQTIRDSSLEAWTKFYQANESTPYQVVSYYSKGAVVALCFDSLLRQHGSSLDALLLRLWQRFGIRQQGLDHDDILQATHELVGDAADTFLQAALFTTDELDWQGALKALGIQVDIPEPTLSLGVKIAAAEGGVLLKQVDPNGPAALAGLSTGDLVVAVDGLRVNAANWEKRLKLYDADERFSVYAFRRDEWLSTTCSLSLAEPDRCELSLPSNAQGQKVLTEQSWLPIITVK